MQAESVSDAPKLPAATVPLPQKSPTPWTWRAAIGIGIVVLLGLAYLLRDIITPRGQAVAGIFCFFGLVAMFSENLRAVNWRTIGWGIALQIILAIIVLKVPIAHDAIEKVKDLVGKFMDFSDAGSRFVFGNLANPG